MKLIGTFARVACGFAMVLAAGAGPAEAQLLGEKVPIGPRWEVAAQVGLDVGDPILFAWAFTGARRLNHWLAIVGEAGKEGAGWAKCNETTCLPPPIPADFCPCPRRDHYLYNDFLAIGPKVQITGRFFAHVLVGKLSNDFVPAETLIRPGVGWDFGDQRSAFRVEVNYDVVPGRRNFSRVRGLIGLVIRIGRR